MAKVYPNRVWVNTATTGTGTVTLGAALDNYFTAAEAGVADGDLVDYTIIDGTDVEMGLGTYASAGPTVARTTVTASKIGGTAGTSKINLSGAATIFFTKLSASFPIPVDIQTFTTPGADTWTKPTGGQTMARVQLWAAGGSGGKGSATNAGGGGGGGEYKEFTLPLSSFDATEPVSIGTGGAAQATAGTDGNVGGNTTFDVGAVTHIAYGGGPGEKGLGPSNPAAGGDGGGPFAAGVAAGARVITDLVHWQNAAFTHGRSYDPGLSIDALPGHGYFSGAGGASASTATNVNAAGGNSVWGGAGGGAGAEDAAPGPGAGGTSEHGGAGGAGAFDTNDATAGSARGGGGGGSEAGTSGAGGRGEVVVTCW